MSLLSFPYTPPPIRSDQFIGPKVQPNKPVRVKHPLIDNLTISLHDDRTKIKAEDHRDMVRQYAEVIEEHIDRRVMSFWHQLVACYGTRLHLELDFTMDQGQSAKRMKVKIAGEAEGEITRNAAHSTTIPSLSACRMKEWKRYQAGEIDKPEMYSFLKGSALYNLTNSTIEVIDVINQADIKIDGEKHDSKFSLKSFDLLNQASMAKISPEDALMIFVNSAISMTAIQAIDDSFEEGINEALKLFLIQLKNVRKRLKTNRYWVYEHLDLNTLKDKSVKMKATALKLRSLAIRNNLLGQAKMADMIDHDKQKIFNRIRKERGPKGKLPPSSEKAFNYLLIDSMKTSRDKLRMKKFLALPPLEYQDKLKKGVSKITKAEAFLQPDIKKIRFLAGELSNHMRSMRTEEQLHRGETLKMLRVAKEWSREELSKRLKERFPDEPGSCSTIYRDESGRRPLTLEHARKLSKVMKIPMALLAPQFFNK